MDRRFQIRDFHELRIWSVRLHEINRARKDAADQKVQLRFASQMRQAHICHDRIMNVRQEISAFLESNRTSANRDVIGFYRDRFRSTFDVPFKH